MPQEPKKRHSRQRQGKRRATIRFSFPQGIMCKNCKEWILPHIICPHCGYYAGRSVLAVKKEEPKGKSLEQ